MKLKRPVLLPLALLLYLVAISIYAWPGRNPSITFNQYWITIGVTAVCIIVLIFVLRKREQFRNRNRKP